MYKVFTLAIAVSVVPLSQKNLMVNLYVTNNVEKPAYIFPFKNTITTNPFEPEKKPAEPWSQNWITTAQENIRKSEYHFTWKEKRKAYCTPNRKNNLRFFYNDKGFSVEPRTTQIPIGEFDPLKMPGEIKNKTIPNWKINLNLDKRQVGKGTWRVSDNKAEYLTDKITVEYINSDEGMRQNFIVRSPLSKEDELKLHFSIKTKLKTKLSKNQLQFFHKKNNVLNYKDLKVWDANGKALAASFQKRKKRKYYIQVDIKDAVYPITVDPISTVPAAMVESNQAIAFMGWSVASAGDVNGDGYSDVIVGTPNYDNGQTDEGAAFVYHGSAAGINTTAAASVESNQASAQMGYSVASAGDINGDGYSDVIVGAVNYDNGQTDEGAAFIYHGSGAGINTTAASMVESNQANAQMGWHVAIAGDVNGDKYSDVIVGAPYYDNGQTDEGAAFVYHGSAAGINITAAASVESNQVNACIGWYVAGAGDVNGDGYSDVIVGALYYDNGQTDEGAAFVYHGSAAGINTTVAAMVESNQASAQMGESVASAGDVNGDGYSDVMVGAYFYDNGQSDEGAAFVYHGSATGINTVAATIVESNQATALMGISVACAGDINGDGYSDVIVGAYFYDKGQSDEGVAFVYHGSAAGINTTAAAIVESNQANALMGSSVSSAGDVNGDGYSDVIVGAVYYDNGQSNEGIAFVYHGSAAGINTTPVAMTESNQDDTFFGIYVANAGDINRDGYSDVIVGAPQYDGGENNEGGGFIYYGSAAGIGTTVVTIIQSNQINSQMGRSVSSGGDINGDGYADVLMGGTGYDAGQSNEGACFVHYGSATGINSSPDVVLQSNQVNGNMGISVASAGDVNGDGYSDVITGVYNYTNGQTSEGAAFVYHGSAAGINTTPAAIVQSNQVNAVMGISVAGAGDVNGDGFSDVVVGDDYYTNGNTREGAAFIYHGSLTGISTTAAAVVESNSHDAEMGQSVSSAGDVNGDGYSDVVVGANYLENGHPLEGAIYVFHGSATGINTAPAAYFESNSVSALLGTSVACAGDVNGDGYSDVVAGAMTYDNVESDEGAVYLFLGSPGGMITTPTAIIESNQNQAYLGVAVAGAGDVNGDGYSDVFAGAFSYDNGQPNEGAAFIYLGNSPGINKRNNVRLYNSDLVTPINSSNFNFSNFGTGLYARSFLGRSKGKLVWETRLNYNAYSGSPITNSTFYTYQQSTYIDMGLGGLELKNLIAKIGGGRYTKLRARIKYDPVTALTGQVYSPWRNVSSIIDANNLGVLPIELISFNAAWIHKGETARIDFTTDKESGICCFDIEKSADGFNFFAIGTLPAINTTGIQSYSFIDGNATNKKQFYRLKIKGIAGQVDYSDIQQLQNNGGTEIVVFPNPTTDVLHLQLNKVYDKMTVQIVNSGGQLVKQMQLTPTNQTISIAVQNLAAGKYWLRLQGGDEKQVLQFVKQ